MERYFEQNSVPLGESKDPNLSPPEPKLGYQGRTEGSLFRMDEELVTQVLVVIHHFGVIGSDSEVLHFILLAMERNRSPGEIPPQYSINQVAQLLPIFVRSNQEQLVLCSFVLIKLLHQVDQEKVGA